MDRAPLAARPDPDADRPILRKLGRADYAPTWAAMQRFTDERTAHTADELWQVEHPPVYTVGLAGREEHLPDGRCEIPIVRIDRGGQITYHGPGQIVLYTLVDLSRRGLGVRAYVRLLEQAVIDLLGHRGVHAEGRTEAPGVYVDGAKIAALGLRIRHGRCYHGLALNVDMDLSPFERIDPCGYRGLRVTQARACGIADPIDLLADELSAIVSDRLCRTKAGAS
jgi:lipoyl(octanoyl) transferase